MYYPIALNIERKKIVIVGGGMIATQKLRTLQGYGAYVTLISPTITDEAKTLLQALDGVWHERNFEKDDVNDAFIVFVATNNKEVNEAVSAAVNAQQLILRADDVSQGNMLNQAVVRRGALSIAVCTDGASPSLTRKLKQRLEEQFPASYDAYVSFLAQARQHILANVPRDKSRALLGRLVDEELEQYVAQGELQRAWATVHKWLDEANV
ncbi:precorrin-2 dehydrogenase/sirohydrochlorin ferrochelatase family protein [Caryophanon latum]|uniref:precorrin-2 dehydrogenase n=1 Tax=Caryophanon latum TaxID=33977 RepID=A0A1C0YTL0_9BACL|nr:NAD(P)-dependent oxidoreductase [Caryophanon latum]OCS90489.1 hypothetical protein A6K76_11530 [Caryophanon latum]